MRRGLKEIQLETINQTIRGNKSSNEKREAAAEEYALKNMYSENRTVSFQLCVSKILSATADR